MFLENSPSQTLTFIISTSLLSNCRLLDQSKNINVKLIKDTKNPKLRKSEMSTYSGFKDVSYCLPCLCVRNMDNVLTADCSYRTNKRIPDGLPVTITSLDMSTNIIHQFDTASVLSYPMLTTLVIHKNYLTEIVHVSMVNTSSKLTSLDLSYNSIRTIQKGSFRCLGNLRDLKLGGNVLMNISAEMFEGFQNLKILNLTKNSIRHIDNNTFDLLESLESLDLSRNELHFTSIDAFERLINLQELFLQRNLNKNQPYPSKGLSKLSNLSHLYLDVNVDSKFDSQMKSLKKLTSLFFGAYPGYCNKRNITRDFLENTPYLTTLMMNGCHLSYIDPSVYDNVKKLEILEISYTPWNYDVCKALSQLQGLVNSSLKTLRLVSLSQDQYLYRSLRKEQAKYLQYIALEELDMSRNRIALICSEFAKLLPRSLKRLVLTDNELTVKAFHLNILYFLTELSEIYLDRQNANLQSNHVTCLNGVLLYDDLHTDVTALRNTKADINITGYVSNNCTTDATRDAFILSKSSPESLCSLAPPNYCHKTEIRIPPNLKSVKGALFAQFGTHLFQMNRKKNNSITDITFNNNFLLNWGVGVLPKQVQNADISHNFAYKLSAHFFNVNKVVVSLNISNNILGESFAADRKGQIFSNLSKLQFLDISINLVYSLPRQIFKGLTSLEILLACNNRLQTLNISISHMSSLRFMNFSQNSITWIDQTTRDDLDILASTHTVYLDLSFNPLPCTCEGLPVLQWMAYTNVNLVNQIYLRCHSEGGKMSDFGDLNARVTQVQRACASRAIILVISISFSVVITLFITLALVYRFRWKIRYLRNMALAKFVGFKPRTTRGDNYQYDAYILYDEELLNFVLKDFVQELEVKRGHRLLLSDRDVIPGTFMATGVLSAVQNSYKTIPVVTPDFYDGLYSEYAVKMAFLEEIYGRREILHLCLYQPTDPEEMSKDLLSIMHRNHYTEYPPEQDKTEDLVEHFWDQLSGCIQQNI